ncbi:MAG: diguanylate cyclase response regulator [Spirochaetae bacterium HGW-Spirochaetae-1]|nr:MAG: diguanylate cyclase response regulator [Spirochaetae bacterium HGW-Spirochaetae-1]
MFAILHVDNSSFFKHIVKDIFSRNGFTCYSADDVSTAMEIIRDRKIDLIITALEIRGGGGEKLIRDINNSPYKNIPIVMITGNDSMEVRKKMFSLGVIDYIPKDPTFRDQLLSFVDTLTEKSGIREQLKNMEVAVLDDSRMELSIVENLLRLNGITKVDFFSKAEKLLDSEKQYHIYFIDLILPGISGEQVIIEIRKRFPDSVIIAISGIDNYKVISSILLSGADDYMLKPFNQSIFMARLIANARTYVLLQEIERKNSRLETVVSTDQLTGVYNHQYLFEQLEEEIRKTKSVKGSLSLLLFGIDHFMFINDAFGHQTGDKVIITIADIIRSGISKNAILGRYSGASFLVILPDVSFDNAFSIAESIRKAANRIKIKDNTITLSAGAVQFEGETANELIKKADSLLFNARKKGKNRTEKVFDWHVSR